MMFPSLGRAPRGTRNGLYIDERTHSQSSSVALTVHGSSSTLTCKVRKNHPLNSYIYYCFPQQFAFHKPNKQPTPESVWPANVL